MYIPEIQTKNLPLPTFLGLAQEQNIALAKAIYYTLKLCYSKGKKKIKKKEEIHEWEEKIWWV